MTSVLRSSVDRAKFREMRDAGQIIAADNYVPQFPKVGHENYFWQIIAVKTFY